MHVGWTERFMFLEEEIGTLTRRSWLRGWAGRFSPGVRKRRRRPLNSRWLHYFYKWKWYVFTEHWLRKWSFIRQLHQPIGQPWRLSLGHFPCSSYAWLTAPRHLAPPVFVISFCSRAPHRPGVRPRPMGQKNRNRPGIYLKHCQI